MNNSTQKSTASLFKRLMSMVYDLFLLAAVLFIAEIFPLILNHGEAVSLENGAVLFYFLHPLYLLLISFVFLGWFWTHGGQTLGMKTWRLQMQSIDGSTINWNQAAMRFIGALISWLVIGLGFLWILIDKNGHSWHDIMSKSEIIQLEKK